MCDQLSAAEILSIVQPAGSPQPSITGFRALPLSDLPCLLNGAWSSHSDPRLLSLPVANSPCLSLPHPLHPAGPTASPSHPKPLPEPCPGFPPAKSHGPQRQTKPFPPKKAAATSVFNRIFFLLYYYLINNQQIYNCEHLTGSDILPQMLTKSLSIMGNT